MKRLERWLFAMGLTLLTFWVGESLQSVVVSHAAVAQFAVQEATGVPNPDAPLAVLRIPKIQLEVPVFDGTDAATLDHGAGRIAGTAQVGGGGNVGIAAHRDRFFRGLKDVVPGDPIELARPGQTDRYIIDWIRVVRPTDVFVLEPTPGPAVTLVTCFPFYFIGSAPQRYIVRASLQFQMITKRR